MDFRGPKSILSLDSEIRLVHTAEPIGWRRPIGRDFGPTLCTCQPRKKRTRRTRKGLFQCFPCSFFRGKPPRITRISRRSHPEKIQGAQKTSVFSVCILQWPALSVVASNFGIEAKTFPITRLYNAAFLGTAFRNYGNVCWWAPIPL